MTVKVPDLPKVTLGIVTYRDQEQLQACLLSVLRLESALDVIGEIVIVDNDVDKASHSTVTEISRSCDVPISYLANFENNIGSARALVVSRANYSLVAFTDPDCRAGENYIVGLREATQKFQSNQALGAVTGPIAIAANENFKQLLEHIFSWQIMSRAFPQFAQTYRLNKPPVNVSTSNAVFYRETALAAGNFSPLFSQVAEDLEFSFRLQKMNYELGFVEAMHVVHAIDFKFAHWMRKMYFYGQGQMRVFRLYPKLFMQKKAMAFAPAVFLLVYFLAGAPAWLALAVLALSAIAFGPLGAVVVWLSGAAILVGQLSAAIGRFAAPSPNRAPGTF